MSATIKDNVIEMIRRMPDDATVTDIMPNCTSARKSTSASNNSMQDTRCRKRKSSKGSADG